MNNFSEKSGPGPIPGLGKQGIVSATAFESHKKVYAQHADQYELMAQREDYQHQILPALQQIRPLEGLDIVELGAGTGRLTRLVAPYVRRIWAFDASTHMLSRASAKLHTAELTNGYVAAADHRQIPLPAGSADLVLSGWSLFYLVVWYPFSWQNELRRVFEEVRRVLRPGGRVIILESLGTGLETPHSINVLDGYFKFLEENGFGYRWIRTDYWFESMKEIETLLHFFFGDSMTQAEIERMISYYFGKQPPEKLILPQCTGIWWL